MDSRHRVPISNTGPILEGRALFPEGKNKDGKKKPLRRRAFKRDKHVRPSGHSGKRHGHLRKHRVHKRRF
jgi:hypothetical protein